VTRRRSYFEAAVQVLTKAGRPLSTTEITDHALSQGLIMPRGKTPRDTMSAVLYTTIRDDPATPLLRLHHPGETHTRANTVRWVLRDTSSYNKTG
jgi:HB1, ASXL, restriction endonuclease HTH domain